MTVLADGQASYRGLLLGAGTAFGLRSVEGLEGVDVRFPNRPIPRGAGSIPASSYANDRTPIIEFVVHRVDGVTLAERLRQLHDVLTPIDTPAAFEWKWEGAPQRRVMAVPHIVPAQKQARIADIVAYPKVSLWCPDPRIYGADMHSQLVPLYSTGGGGLDYPVDYPKEYTSGPSTDVVVTNAGNDDAWPLVRFSGPTVGTVTGVTIRNVTIGEQVEITTTLTTGQILTFDGEAYVTRAPRQIVAVDGTERYDDWELPHRPLRLPPGESQLRFEITGTSTDAQCLVSWSDTWIT